VNQSIANCIVIITLPTACHPLLHDARYFPISQESRKEKILFLNDALSSVCWHMSVLKIVSYGIFRKLLTTSLVSYAGRKHVNLTHFYTAHFASHTCLFLQRMLLWNKLLTRAVAYDKSRRSALSPWLRFNVKECLPDNGKYDMFYV